MNKELIKDIDNKFYTAKNDNVFKAIFCDEKDTYLLKITIRDINNFYQLKKI